VKPTRLICPHARGGPVGPSAFTPHSSHRPGRVMRRRVLSRGVPLPAVPGLTRPCRTRGPSLCSVFGRVRRTVPSRVHARHALPRPAALLGFLPFAGLLPHPGGRRGACTAAKLRVSDISVRPGPRVVRAKSVRVPINFRRDDRPPVGTMSDLKRRSIVRMIRLRLLGFDSRLRSAARPPRPRSDPALGFFLLQGLTGT